MPTSQGFPLGLTEKKLNVIITVWWFLYDVNVASDWNAAPFILLDPLSVHCRLQWSQGCQFTLVMCHLFSSCFNTSQCHGKYKTENTTTMQMLQQVNLMVHSSITAFYISFSKHLAVKNCFIVIQDSYIFFCFGMSTVVIVLHIFHTRHRNHWLLKSTDNWINWIPPVYTIKRLHTQCTFKQFYPLFGAKCVPDKSRIPSELSNSIVS